MTVIDDEDSEGDEREGMSRRPLKRMKAYAQIPHGSDKPEATSDDASYKGSESEIPAKTRKQKTHIRDTIQTYRQDPATRVKGAVQVAPADETVCDTLFRLFVSYVQNDKSLIRMFVALRSCLLFTN